MSLGNFGKRFAVSEKIIRFHPLHNAELFAVRPMHFHIFAVRRDAVGKLYPQHFFNHAHAAVGEMRANGIADIRHGAGDPHAAVFYPLFNPVGKIIVLKRHLKRREKNLVF